MKVTYWSHIGEANNYGKDNAGALISEIGGCWPLREVGCGLLVAMRKEETKGKNIDSGTPPPSPHPSFLSLVIRVKLG